jgi:ElaB/YqjD/DUF883 family membrane-anchored ribosome-binding protein
MPDNDTSPRGNGTTGRTQAAADNLADTPRRIKSAVAPEAESLEAQVAQLQNDLKSITDTLNRMGHTAGNELRATGQSALNYAHDEFGQLEKQARDTIREKPLTAVAGAVAVGFMLAVLTR